MSLLLSASISCKKQDAPAEILVQNLFVTSLKSNAIRLTYNLSELGYSETGIIYYEENNPADEVSIAAFRSEDNLFSVSIEDLKPNTEYGLKVFHKVDGLKKIAPKELLVKTLSGLAGKYSLQIVDGSFSLQDDGLFSVDVEGDNLLELNLTALSISMNSDAIKIAYPTRVNGNRFRMHLSGRVKHTVTGYYLIAKYKGDEILFHVFPGTFDPKQYWISLKPISLPRAYFSVLNNALYTFRGEQVFRWDDEDQRLILLGNMPEGESNWFYEGTAFENQLFFQPKLKSFYPDPQDLSNYKNYLELFSYNPATSSFTAYSLEDRYHGKDEVYLNGQQVFTHKSELYLAFEVGDYSAGSGNGRTKYIYRFNKSTRHFEFLLSPKTEVLNYKYVSLDNQLYLLGSVPVTDQGFKIAATFGIFKVSDNFVPELIYKGGTTAAPLNFDVKGTLAYKGSLLIGSNQASFTIFNPDSRRLDFFQVKEQAAERLFDGFFMYNNILHIRLNATYTNSTINEVSVITPR
jgi:hypothetical protein